MIRAAEEPRDAVYRLVEGRHGRFLCNPNDRYVGRRLGGMNGDCLGFLCYASQVGVLLTIAASWPWPAGAAR